MAIEFEQAEEIVRADPRWIAGVRRRGVKHEDARLDIWAPGLLSQEEEGADKRLLRVITNWQDPKFRFWYWAVLEGLIVTVDLQAGVVTQVWDDDATLHDYGYGHGAINITSGLEELPGPDDPPLKPFNITQPEGSSIRHAPGGSQCLEWYKWTFSYSVDPTHGLQLYHLTYEGDCAKRSVAYKISIAELFVPYGAAGRTWRWRSAFDGGEYGVGNAADLNELRLGLDVPENALLFDCTVADDAGGDPTVVRGCVGAYERDAGLLWKHTDMLTGDVDGRRGLELALTSMATVGNYDYAFDYIFQMDGTLQIRSRLTGIILARGVPHREETDPDCLTDCVNLLSDYLIGPPHQHFFNYRLDLDVDGARNDLLQVDLTSDAVSGQPETDGVFSPKRIHVAVEGFLDHNFHIHRTWHVLNGNPHGRNKHGTPRGYALIPETVSFTYMTDSNPELEEHAGFLKHHVWATRHHDEEQTSSDRYPRTGRAGEGLPRYVRDEESLTNKDVVLWYTFGVTHTPRAEEWPIMTMHGAGFKLVPYNFLSHNAEMALKGKCP